MTPNPAPLSSAGVDTLGAFNFTFSSGFFFYIAPRLRRWEGHPKLQRYLRCVTGLAPLLCDSVCPFLGCPLLC